MKKDYIQPQIITERMQICNLLTASDELVDFKPGQDGEEGDAKMFGRFDYFDYFEDEDY